MGLYMNVQPHQSAENGRAMRAASPVSQILHEFWSSPEEALFDQKIVAAVLDCSESSCERDRWAGTGPPFKKIGRRVVYVKRDIVGWINGHPTFSSTSEYPETQAA